MKIPYKLKRSDWPDSEKGIVVPVILWWLGMPLVLVVILWLLFR